MVDYSSPAVAERLAILEVKMLHLVEIAKLREEKYDEIIEELQSTKAALMSLDKALMRYKGFLGGFIFAASCLGAVIYKAIAPIMLYLRSKA